MAQLTTQKGMILNLQNSIQTFGKTNQDKTKESGKSRAVVDAIFKYRNTKPRAGGAGFCVLEVVFFWFSFAPDKSKY